MPGTRIKLDLEGAGRPFKRKLAILIHLAPNQNFSGLVQHPQRNARGRGPV